MARKVVNLFGDKGTGGNGPSGGGPGGGGTSSDDSDWRKRILYSKEGGAKATAHNIQLILQNHEDMQGVFRLDEFANRIMVCGDLPWNKATPSSKEDSEFTEVDGFRLAAWLGDGANFGMSVRPDQVMAAVEAIAQANKFHPVREYLDRQKWDGEPRIDRMFSDFFGARQDPYTSAVATIFMVSAVARIYQPGCKVDTMLVLEGKQGVGKSTALIALFGPAWHSDAMESPNSKDFYQSLLGFWVVEIGELSSFSKAEVHKVKQMLSSTSDTYRPSYGRYARKFPRQGVFAGTTNEEDWNKDYTGARRFLPVRCAEINVPALRATRDQLWAEAVHLFRNGTQWGKLPEGAEIEQEARYQEDTWVEPITNWLAMVNQPSDPMGGSDPYPDVLTAKVPDKPGFQHVMECTATDIMRHALRLDIGKHGTSEQMRVAKIMKRMGWKKDRRQRGSTRPQVWIRPPDPAPVAPVAAPAGAGAGAPEVGHD